MDAYTNLAVGTVVSPPSPATSGTSLTLATGQGSRFPTAPYNVVVSPGISLPDPSNTEIVRVTSRSGDVLTITRAQESTTARAIVSGDLVSQRLTAKSIDDLKLLIPWLSVSLGGSRAASLPLAVATNDLVNAEPAFTVPSSLSPAVLATARIVADCRSLDPTVNITPRLWNMTSAAAVGTGAACTASAADYSGTNQHQTVAVTLVAGSTYKAEALVAGSGAGTFATFCTIRLEIG